MAAAKSITRTSSTLTSKRHPLVGPALTEILAVYRANAAVLLRLAALIFLPLTLIIEIVGRDSIASGMAVSLTFTGPATFVYGGLIAPIASPRRATGIDTESVASLWKAASPTFNYLLLAGIIYTLATTLGAFALIVPSLIMATIWAAAPAVVRFEETKPLQSFGRSRELVRGEGWRVFGLIFVTLLLVLAISTLLGMLSIAIAGEATGAFVGSWLGVVMSAPLLGLMPTVLYGRLSGDAEKPADATASTDPAHRAPSNDGSS